MGATTAPGWPLLPLRLFLGVTFVYAGLQKLANPAFLTGSGPTSIHAQLAGAARTSPIHGLLGGLSHVSTAVGVVIAVGELAVGLGTLVGLWSRVAAAGGMAISLGLFLSVSYHSSPYFTGSDIVFFFAWTPLLLAGAGGAPALDTWLLARSPSSSSGAGGLSRREVAAAGLVAGLVVVTGGATTLVGRLISGSGTASAGTSFGAGTPPTSRPTVPPTTPSTVPTPTSDPAPTSTTTAPPASIPPGKKLGSASKVPVGGSATFTDPGTGDPGLVIQATSGHFVAFDAICPHAGCTVAYQRGAKIIACPCHGSEFNAETGAVEVGPADRGLALISVQEGGDGNLYVDG
ncbi:MAG TPA: Rieske 2Fe-2S domain-containing protein [Acidimicrobiales bacterium]|jgi:thiosulfate dehydrogenase [quinone] large subunit|nr:Rieske 2Fe-2S domain-containing protein [Acidimicrobiales bacterium]